MDFTTKTKEAAGPLIKATGVPPILPYAVLQGGNKTHPHTKTCCTYFHKKEYQKSINYYFKCAYDLEKPLYVKVYKMQTKAVRCEYSDIASGDKALFELFKKIQIPPDSVPVSKNKDAITVLKELIDRDEGLGFYTDLTLKEVPQVTSQLEAGAVIAKITMSISKNEE